MDICNVGEQEAASLFSKAGENLKVAVIMNLSDLSLGESTKLLRESGGSLKKAIESISSRMGNP